MESDIRLRKRTSNLIARYDQSRMKPVIDEMIREASGGGKVLPRIPEVDFSLLGRNDLLVVFAAMQRVLLPIWEKQIEIENLNSKISAGNIVINSINTPGFLFNALTFVAGLAGFAAGGSFCSYVSSAIFGHGLLEGISALAGGFAGIFVAGTILILLRNSLIANPRIKEYYVQNIAPLEERKNFLQKAIRNYSKLPEIVKLKNLFGETYLRYDIIDSLAYYVKVHRADNLKDAINLYESESRYQTELERKRREEEKRREIAQKLSDSYDELKDMNERLKDLEYNIKYRQY